MPGIDDDSLRIKRRRTLSTVLLGAGAAAGHGAAGGRDRGRQAGLDRRPQSQSDRLWDPCVPQLLAERAAAGAGDRVQGGREVAAP